MLLETQIFALCPGMSDDCMRYTLPPLDKAGFWAKYQGGCVNIKRGASARPEIFSEFRQNSVSFVLKIMHLWSVKS